MVLPVGTGGQRRFRPFSLKGRILVLKNDIGGANIIEGRRFDRKTTTEKREPKKFKISCEIQVWTFYMYLVAVLANWRAGHGPQGALEIEFEDVNETRSKYEDSNKLQAFLPSSRGVV